MTSVKFAALSQFIAEQVIESVSEAASANLYITIGKVESWANDSSPDIPTNTIQQEIDLWKNMHFAKKITGNDLALVVRRINWTANTVYTPYSHNTDITTSDYYVMTSDYNIYKCLENNMGANSTVEPAYTGTSTTNRTSDGYLWKYLYSLSASDRLRFMTNDWIPVNKLTRDNGSIQWRVQDSADAGAIEAIKINSRGQGFTSNISSNVSFTGDGEGLTANVIANTVSNSVSYIVVTSRGFDYTHANLTIATSNTSANGVNAEVVISPFGGHGSDPAHELKAATLMINIRLKGDENQRLKVGNDFRQVGLLRDPLVFGSSNTMANTVASQVMQVDLAGFGADYALDEWVYQGPSLAAFTFKGKVVYFSANFLELANTEGTITSAGITGATSASHRFVTNYTNPDLEPYSGHILYVDNRLPISRSNTQLENLQIPIQL